jgi:hypothetical protein
LPSKSFIEQPQAFNAQQSIKLQFLSFNNHKLALNAFNYLPIPSLNNHKLKCTATIKLQFLSFEYHKLALNAMKLPQACNA